MPGLRCGGFRCCTCTSSGGRTRRGSSSYHAMCCFPCLGLIVRAAAALLRLAARGASCHAGLWCAARATGRQSVSGCQEPTRSARGACRSSFRCRSSVSQPLVGVRCAFALGSLAVFLSWWPHQRGGGSGGGGRRRSPSPRASCIHPFLCSKRGAGPNMAARRHAVGTLPVVLSLAALSAQRAHAPSDIPLAPPRWWRGTEPGAAAAGTCAAA